MLKQDKHGFWRHEICEWCAGRGEIDESECQELFPDDECEDLDCWECSGSGIGDSKVFVPEMALDWDDVWRHYSIYKENSIWRVDVQEDALDMLVQLAYRRKPETIDFLKRFLRTERNFAHDHILVLVREVRDYLIEAYYRHSEYEMNLFGEEIVT